MSREEMKLLIELSSDVYEVNSLIEEAGFLAIREKIAFLKGMFDFNIIGQFNDVQIRQEDAEEMDYYAIVSTIINEKWEA